MLSFNSGETTLKKGQIGDYTKVLYLFPYSGEENAGKVRSEMDAAIAKAQKLVRKHSITVKPKKKSGGGADYERFYNQREFNRWVDDAYMLIGKSHLYNHEFNDAVMAFDYVLREFNSQPARFEAAIWLARTRIEMGDFDNALLMLNRYDQMGAAPNRLYGEFMATYADYHIRQRQYAAAIPYMSVAASSASGKWKKIRWNYVLAQLYQIDEQHQNAKNSYTKVLRYSPDYETNLNARLNLAVITARVDGNHTASRKILNKLARQAKNREFRDRIYYTLAQSYRDEKDTVPTITNLQLSSGYNASNKPLKREAYYELAELYFADEQYVPSFAYYDSTMTVIAETDQRLKQIRFRHEGLKDLAANFGVIELEDSLQNLAKMDSTELDQLIEAIIAQKRMEHMEAQRAAESGGGYGGLGNDPFFFNSNGQLSSPTGGAMGNQGQWYFYNPATVSLGKMDFEKRWGRRTAEDNWRRSDKGMSEMLAATQSETSTGASDSTQQAEGDMPTREGAATQGTGGATTSADGIPTKEVLMANIPLTEEMMATSNDKLAVAHFNAGIVFLDHFSDPVKATREFRTMFERFPEHELTDQALFWTYRSYVMLGNSKGMEEMQQTLRERFPDSRYTVFASDPLYAEKHLKKEERENQAYELAFAAYEGSRFNDSFEAAGQLIDSTENASLKRKSHLLRAMNYGRMGNNTGFESELKLLTAGDYTDTQEGKLASRWLKMLADGRVPIPGPVITADGSVATETGKAAASADLYAYEPDAEQLLVLIINNETDYNRLYFNLADYNFTRFILTDYDIESKRLADSRRVITIGKFKNQNEVTDYFYSLRDNTPLFNVDNIGEPLIMAGSEANVGALMSSGDVTGFTQFFSRSYLKGASGIVISVFGAKPVDEGEEFAFKRAEASDSVYWAMIAPRGRVDEQRITTLLAGFAQSNMSNAQINIRTEKLITDENVFIIESYKSAQEVEQFFASFATNFAWTSLPGVRNWTKVAITPKNFDILMLGKSVNDYVEFLKE